MSTPTVDNRLLDALANHTFAPTGRPLLDEMFDAFDEVPENPASPIVVLQARIRGVDCEIEATIQEDGDGVWTSIDITEVEDGTLMAEGWADGPLTEIDVWRLAKALSAGLPTPEITWLDDTVAVAA